MINVNLKSLVDKMSPTLRDSLEDRRAAEEQDQSMKESLKAFRNALSDTRDRAGGEG